MECTNPKFDKKTGKPLPGFDEQGNKIAVEEPAQIALESPTPVEPAPAPAIPQGNITMEQLLAILTEMKKPNEVEQFHYDQAKKKIEEEQENRKRLALRARENAERADRIRNQGQAMCGHRKENGTTAWAGQVNSDGNTRFLCIRCGEVLPPVKAPDDWKTGGINTQMGADVSGAMRFITKEMIISWHRSTHPGCHQSCCVRQPEMAIA